jgi:hypothetical protein
VIPVQKAAGAYPPPSKTRTGPASSQRSVCAVAPALGPDDGVRYSVFDQNWGFT